MIFLFVPARGLDSVIAGLKRAKEHGGEGPRHESDRLGVEGRKNLAPLSRTKSAREITRQRHSGLVALRRGGDQRRTLQPRITRITLMISSPALNPRYPRHPWFSVPAFTRSILPLIVRYFRRTVAQFKACTDLLDLGRLLFQTPV
jgi:hypothetical protein